MCGSRVSLSTDTEESQTQHHCEHNVMAVLLPVFAQCLLLFRNASGYHCKNQDAHVFAKGRRGFLGS